MTESCRLVTTEQYKEYQTLKKKLDIAVKTLEYYADIDMYRYCYVDETPAAVALKEIEEVK